MNQDHDNSFLEPTEQKPLDRWFLTGHLTIDGPMQDFDIGGSSFRIGRKSGLDLTLPWAAVSNMHAEILIEQNELSIKDLKSTNGTFINGTRVTQTQPLRAGDLIQFANVPFRLNQAPAENANQPQIEEEKPDKTGMTVADFDQFLRMRTVVPHFQPIVSLKDKSLVGYEVLARSRVRGLQTPQEMFLAASQLNLEQQLSSILRLIGLEKGMMLHRSPCLFINTHAAEISTFGLLDSLERLRELNPDQPITLEIREPVAKDTAIIRQLRETLTELNMHLAYDHFGSGTSQRAQLAAIRPDYVKLDMHLIREIHLAPASQKALLTNLVKMVQDLGIIPVAMGVESEFEHAACRDLGFELGQGFFYGKPSAGIEDATAAPELGYV
jgi:EAL domain-containing protein (putative c-di-GMP-specific phosphodiesterase class I)